MKKALVALLIVLGVCTVLNGIVMASAGGGIEPKAMRNSRVSPFSAGGGIEPQ